MSGGAALASNHIRSNEKGLIHMEQQVATMSTSAAPLKRAITDEEITQYRRDGVVCLRDVLTSEWIDTIRAGIDEQREQPGPYATVFQSERSYTIAEQVSSNFNEKLRRAVLQSGAGQIAQAMLQAPQVRLLHDNIFYKDAGDIIETPWHQDTANGCFDGMNMIRIWIPVDPVARQTAIEVVRASHLWNAFYVSGDLDAYKAQAVNAGSQRVLLRPLAGTLREDPRHRGAPGFIRHHRLPDATRRRCRVQFPPAAPCRRGSGQQDQAPCAVDHLWR